jgi:hypothetical protein
MVTVHLPFFENHLNSNKQNSGLRIVVVGKSRHYEFDGQQREFARPPMPRPAQSARFLFATGAVF